MQFKQMGFALLVLVILAVGFGFWASKSPSGVPGTQEQHVLAGEMIGEGEYQYSEDEPYYTITASYPVGRFSIEQALAARIAEFKANGDFANLTAEDVQIQGLGPDRKYALDMQYKTYTASAYTSYLYTIYEDTLGAHPNGYYLTFVFNKNGDKVELSQLFPQNPNWLEELSLLVSNDVVAQMKVRAGQDDVTGLLFAEGLSPTVENFSNFVIDNDTFVVMLPPYQVAAYAVGSFEVRIPLKDLQ